MIYAHENHKEITKKILELAHEFTEVTAKKVNIQNAGLLNNENELMETEI